MVEGYGIFLPFCYLSFKFLNQRFGRKQNDNNGENTGIEDDSCVITLGGYRDDSHQAVYKSVIQPENQAASQKSQKNSCQYVAGVVDS